MSDIDMNKAAEALYGAPSKPATGQTVSTGNPASEPSLAGNAPAAEKAAEDVFYAPSEKTTADLYYKSLAGDQELAEFVAGNSDGDDVHEVHQKLGEQLHSINVTAAEASTFLAAYNRASHFTDEQFAAREKEFLEHATRQDDSYREALMGAAEIIQQTWGSEWLAALRDSGALYSAAMADRLVELYRRHVRAKAGH